METLRILTLCCRVLDCLALLFAKQLAVVSNAWPVVVGVVTMFCIRFVAAEFYGSICGLKTDCGQRDGCAGGGILRRRKRADCGVFVWTVCGAHSS